MFDVGETLIDESTEYGTWADWIKIPRHTFSATFGALIALGYDYRDVFRVFQPDFDLDTERDRRAAAGCPETFGADDLYPDARPVLQQLRDGGWWIGVAGNHTARAGEILHSLQLPADMIATSASWGAAKPASTFFDRLVTATPYEPGEICYVGDRLDWDIRPTHAAGLRTAWIRRGPWLNLRDDEAVAMATFHLTSLRDLPRMLATFNATH